MVQGCWRDDLHSGLVGISLGWGLEGGCSREVSCVVTRDPLGMGEGMVKRIKASKRIEEARENYRREKIKEDHKVTNTHIARYY